MRLFSNSDVADERTSTKVLDVNPCDSVYSCGHTRHILAVTKVKGSAASEEGCYITSMHTSPFLMCRHRFALESNSTQILLHYRGIYTM